VLPAPYYFISNSAAGDSHIVRLERDGTTRTNIVDEPPAPAMMILEFDISPVDGSLAYIVQGANGNSLVQTDPTGKHRTVLIADASVNTVRWSPDGKTIAVAVYQAPDTTEGMAGGVYLIPASGGQPTLIQANDPIADPNNPDPAARGYTPSAWSPDSQRLLLGTFSQTIDICGSAVKDLATGALVDIVPPEPLNACGGIWSADGSTIYPNMMRPGYMAPVPGLWRADARTGEMTVHIAGEPQPSQFTLVRGVHGLNDGSAYAFLATTSKLPDVAEDANVVWPRFALVHVSSDGTTIKPIGSATFENPGDAVSWAANGSGALLTQFDAKANTSSLVWLPTDGGEAVVIANDIGANGHWGLQ
jgi:dipeptidyl aminopeptidase/acylaminoacyl peptidase